MALDIATPLGTEASFILGHVIEIQVANFAVWLKERKVTDVSHKHIEPLIKVSIAFDGIFCKDNPDRIIKKKGLDDALVDVFENVKASFKACPAASKARARQALNVHRDWMDRIPSSCCNAENVLRRIFQLVDESEIEVYFSFRFWHRLIRLIRLQDQKRAQEAAKALKRDQEAAEALKRDQEAAESVKEHQEVSRDRKRHHKPSGDPNRYQGPSEHRSKAEKPSRHLKSDKEASEHRQRGKKEQKLVVYRGGHS